MGMTDLLNWLYDPSDNVLMVVVSVVAIFIVLGVCTRFGRLRSLSQMSGFDFGVNVAVGSIIAATVLSPDPSVFRAGVALATIFSMQVLYSMVRRKSDVIDNPSSQPPHVIWHDGAFIEEHMKATMFTKEDIFHAMRTSQVHSFDEVRFIIIEATGDVTIFGAGDTALSKEIFEGVVGSERLGLA